MPEKRCILCGQRPAELPDREAYPNMRKQVCAHCHAARLAADLRAVLPQGNRRQQPNRAA